MDLVAFSKLRAQLVADLHSNNRHESDSCEGCGSAADQALVTIGRAGWLDRLAPDDATAELAVVINAVGWALFADDGRAQELTAEGVPTITVTDAETERCAHIAERALRHLAVVRSRQLVAVADVQ